MTTGPTILKNPALTDDQNYAFLRQTGLGYLETLGSNQWTDYNEHDPGITIMEALCYAITELGFRTALPMQDLLTQADGTIPDSQTLYTAKTILTQSPLNVDDYRKLLIDIVGVHNAWMQYAPYNTIDDKKVPAGEVAIFADCDKDELAYYTTPHPIYLSGLYNVLLDLDNDEQFGDLNNGEIQVLNPASGTFKVGTVSMTVVFPVWDDASVTSLLNAKPESVTVTGINFPAGSNITATIAFSYTTMQGAAANGSLTAIVSVDLQPSGKTVAASDIQGFFNTSGFSAQVISLYLMKIQKSKSIIATAIKTLNQNRNLCEDFVSVKTITDEEIAICCDIDVEPSADMEQVQAQVLFAIQDYLDPSVNFYTLADMQGKGYTTDQIFEGPVLQHGFIDTTELEQTQLRDEIYGSKIISLIMNIENVLAVRNFRMTKYDVNENPIAAETGKQWCMPITPGCKPVLAETKSKITFYKNDFPYLTAFADVQSILNWMNAAKARNKLSGYTGDIPIPQGTWFPLDSYTSITNLFPRTYGVGPAGLPPSATVERNAQANQLKAYLLFYDQILADFFSLLDNAKSLFSTDAIVQTYFAQFLDGIKDILPVYAQNAGKTINELVMQNQDSTDPPVNPWQQLYEANDTYLDRRNRFLDHLMSRFAESFNQYVLLMYSLDYTTQQETSIDPTDLINSKIQFLKDYPTTSYQRGRAYNCFPEKADGTVDTSQLWDTDNVSGAEKKLSSLGGYSNYFRRFLFCFCNADILPTADMPPKYQFSFSDGNGNTLTSVTKYADEDSLMEALPGVIDAVWGDGNIIVKQNGAVWNIFVVDSSGNNLAESNDFTSADLANASLSLFLNLFDTFCTEEGMHLIEHILLRPRNSNFYLAPVCLDPDCDFCGEQDPYSFRISVVLPYWPPHFKSMAFRTYFENIIRQELPAHAIVKICWLDDTTMYNFDIAYKAWIIALANYEFAPTDVTIVNEFEAANKKLLQIIFSMYSQYPVATLHDCDESQNTNTVQLGKTILGSIKN